MRTLLLTFLLVLFAAPAAAQTSDAELRQLVQRAAQAIENPGNQADRDAAARALRQAIHALEQSGAVQERPAARGHHRRRGGNAHVEHCIDLGFEVYKQSMYEQGALDKAVQQCSDPVDGNVLNIAYGVYTKTMYAAGAFEKAVQFSKRSEVMGKADLLNFAFEKYKQTMQDSSALEKAAQWVAPLQRRDESCIRRAYEVASKSAYPAGALDKAVDTCK